MKRAVFSWSVLCLCTLLAFLQLVGCQTAPTTDEPADEGLAAASDQAATTSSSSKPNGAAKANSAEAASASSSPLVDRLTEDRWVRAIPTAGSNSRGPQFRWRHPSIEPVQWQTADLAVQLRQALDNDNPVIAANAAIFSARVGSTSNDGLTSERLAQVVRNARLKMPQRCAAAESLGLVREPAAGRTVQKLLDEFGQQEDAATYQVDLHVDLLHALSWTRPQAATSILPRH